MSAFRIKKPQDPNSEQEAYNYCLWLLGKRWWGEQEISKRLKIKGFSVSIIPLVTTRLKEENFLNDERLLDNYIKNQIEVGNIGPVMLKQKLEAKGFSRGVDKILKKFYSNDKQTQNITRLAQKSGIAFHTDKNAKVKLYQRLLRRGFDSGLVLTALNAKE